MRDCMNKPHPRELNRRPRIYQDGWDHQGRKLVPGPKTQWNEDVACGHTESAEDPSCDGCKWQRDTIGFSKEPADFKLTPEIEREARRFIICPLCEGGMFFPRDDIKCPRCHGAGQIGDWTDGDAAEEGQANLAGQAGSR